MDTRNNPVSPSNSSGKIGNAIRMNSPAARVRRGRNAAEFVIFPFKADRKNSRPPPSGRSGARRAEENRPFIADHENSHENPSVHRSKTFVRFLSRESPAFLFLPPPPFFFFLFAVRTFLDLDVENVDWISLRVRENFIFSKYARFLIFIIVREILKFVAIYNLSIK